MIDDLKDVPVEQATKKDVSVVFPLLINAAFALTGFLVILFNTKFKIEKWIILCYLLMAVMGAVSVYATGFYYLQRKKSFAKSIRILLELAPGIVIVFVVAGYLLFPLKFLQGIKTPEFGKKSKSTAVAPAPAVAKPVFTAPKQPAEPNTDGDTIVVTPGPDHSASTITDAIKRAKPGDQIMLFPGVYFQSAAAGPEPPVKIENKKDLKIYSTGGAYVLCEKGATLPVQIMNSRRILIENVYFGHAGHPAQTCSGGVAWLYKADDIIFRDCVFYGSGWSAVAGWMNKRLLVEGCALAECTHQGVDLSFAEDLTFTDNFIAFNCDDDKAGCVLDFVKSKRIIIKNNLFAKNYNCLKNLKQVESMQLVDNIFHSNYYDLPDFESGEEKSSHPKNFIIDDMLGNNDLWPSTKAKYAGNAYHEFIEAKQKFESEHFRK